VTLAEAVGLAHEINNPLEVLVNNLNLLAGYIERVSTDEDFIVESERLDSTQTAVDRIQQIVTTLTDLAQGTEYSTPATRETEKSRLRRRRDLAYRRPSSNDRDPSSRAWPFARPTTTSASAAARSPTQEGCEGSSRRAARHSSGCA
jgi:hypothetical protein